MFETLNTKVAESAVGRWFRLDGSGHPRQREGSLFTTELRAGTTTFFAMAYIIAVNASILADSGGTCVCDSTADDPICLQNEAYALCKEVVRRDLITTSAAVAALASVLMGFFANLPVALAPGLGLNAYFAYSVVGFNGSGSVTYQEALAAVFLEGWLFFILSLFGVRQWLARIIPRSLTLATGAGIGLFIALIGLGSAGLGVVGGDYTNLVGLGGCTSEYRDPDHSNYCLSHVLRSPTMWLGIFVGGIFTTLLLLYRVRGAIIIGILLVSIISWPRTTPVTLFPHTAVGDSNFDFFKKVVTFHKLEKIGNALDYNYGKGQVWIALITFLYVDLFDTTGVNASILADSGGTCVCDSTADDPICLQNEAYALCKEVVRRDLITRPLQQSQLFLRFSWDFSPTFPLHLHLGLVSMPTLHTRSLVSMAPAVSLIKKLLLRFSLRDGSSSSSPCSAQWLARIIPRSLTLATGAGIGLFIALIGLGSAGLGVVGGDYTNLVGLGGCTSECAYLLFS
ncbi:hypothetical protein RSAG8_02262, partial [Rhizoctonia solani AG-8 WAC10335]